MANTPVWKTIAETLTAEITGGGYRAGDRLPPEADLARRFGVNRHTVRRALADLTAGGLTHSRRGAGVFVAAAPTEYPIGRRVRFHSTLRAAGQTPERHLLRLETRRSAAHEATLLEIGPDADVHVYEGTSLADNVPLSVFRSIFPAPRLPGLLDRLRDMSSVTDALAAEGVADYTRRSTRVTATAATPVQAGHLMVRAGDPLLRTDSLNVDCHGQPVEMGRTWFAGDRISLSVTPD